MTMLWSTSAVPLQKGKWLRIFLLSLFLISFFYFPTMNPALASQDFTVQVQQNSFLSYNPWILSSSSLSTTQLKYPVTIAQGTTSNITIQVTSQNGFNSPLSFSLFSNATGITGVFFPDHLTPPTGGSANTVLSLHAASSVTAGNYSVAVTATSGTISHTDTFVVGVGSTGSVTSTMILGLPSTPVAMAFDPKNGNMYVANSGVNEFSAFISVINGNTHTITATIPVGTFPTGIAFDPKNTDIYVANSASGTVSVINSTTNTVMYTIPVGLEPWSVSVDSATGNIYVTDIQNNQTSVINGTTNNVITTIPVGGYPVDGVYDPANGDIYIVNSGTNTVSVINGLTNTITGTIPLKLSLIHI